MMNVISSEFYKIFTSKITYIISFILLALNFYIGILLIFNTRNISEGVNGISMYVDSFNQDGIFYLILGFVCYLITSEYSSGSIKQISSHGIKRYKIVLGRYIAMSLAITFIFIVFGLINLAIVSLKYGIGSIDLSVFLYMNIGLICMILGVSGAGTFIAYLFKNSAAAIVIAFLCVMSKNFISALLTMLTKNNIFTGYSISSMRDIITNLESNSLDVLKCSSVFLLFGLITVTLSCIIFSFRDVD